MSQRTRSIHEYAAKGQIDLLKRTIEAGANVDARDEVRIFPAVLVFWGLFASIHAAGIQFDNICRRRMTVFTYSFLTLFMPLLRTRDTDPEELYDTPAARLRRAQAAVRRCAD